MRSPQKTHWDCVSADHWKTILETPDETNSWAKDEKKAVQSPLLKAKPTLLIAGIILVGVPVLIVMILVIVRCVLKFKATHTGTQAGAETTEDETTTQAPPDSTIQVRRITSATPVSFDDSQQRQLVFKI